MNQGFGNAVPGAHSQTTHREATRYLVVIDAGGSTVARLFLDNLAQVAEFDAGAEEVAALLQGQLPTTGAEGPQWDRPLQGHSAAERAAAAVYTLDV